MQCPFLKWITDNRISRLFQSNIAGPVVVHLNRPVKGIIRFFVITNTLAQKRRILGQFVTDFLRYSVLRVIPDFRISEPT